MTNTDKNDFNATIGNTVLSAVHLAPYLPYELRFSDGTILHSIDIDNELMLLDTKTSGISNHRIEWGKILPVLRPMTMLDGKTWNYENIPVNFLRALGITASEHGYSLREAEEMVYNRRFEPFKIPYILFEQLLKFHFDVFGLIDKGLAMDINTLSVEQQIT